MKTTFIYLPTLGLLALLLLLRVEATTHGPKPTPVYKDPTRSIKERIEDLMSQMTLKEKISQMAQIEITDLTAKIMRDHAIGSVLSGGGSTPRERATAKDWVDMVNNFQNGSLSSRLGVPMIYGIDAVHGHNNVYKATIFPHNVGLGCTRESQSLLGKLAQPQPLKLEPPEFPMSLLLV